MATLSQRFGVGDPNGRRSSEWAVVWKPAASDVYLVTRTLGQTLKASIHERGRCHVKAPDPRAWRSPGDPPRYLDEWVIDPGAAFAHPFGVVIPEPGLADAVWPRFKDRGTIWIPVEQGRGIEVAVFLLRSDFSPDDALARAGWHTRLVDAALPDGRRLLVVAGDSMAHVEQQDELLALRVHARRMLRPADGEPANPRAVLLAVAPGGTRRFVEVAV